jgi:hypothetical protein
MTLKQLLNIRLQNQQLTQHDFKTAGEVVEWMGAVQAQDYLGALWSIGMRLPSAKESEIEKSVDDKTMVRTWPMRGTLHFVSSKDIRWMLKYLATKVHSKVGSVFRREGLDSKQFTRAMKLWEKALVGGRALTREEMYDVLEKGKLSTKGMRGLLMLGYAAQEGLICFGARQGKQHTFVLLDEWLPNASPMLSKEEAMRRLSEIYVRSHGPVLVEDLAWWSGLTKTEANAAVHSFEDKLIAEKIGTKTYWVLDSNNAGKTKSICALLPTYDEFGIAYKDRSPIASKAGLSVYGGNFTSLVMHNGTITGVWRRELNKDSVSIEIKSTGKYSTAQKKLLTTAIKRYGKYLGLNPAFTV